MITKCQKNVIHISFDGHENIRAPEISRYQYDKGQIIQFSDIPDGTQVEFANENHEKAEPYMVKNNQVEIPDFLLEENSPITVYVKLVDESSETTVKTIIIPVKDRPETDMEVPPENQQTFIQQIEEIMNETKNIAKSVRDDADSGEFKGDTGATGPQGPQGPQGLQGPPGIDGAIPIYNESTQTLEFTTGGMADVMVDLIYGGEY